jgi:hypothetical protein
VLAPYVGELWNAAVGGSSETMSVAGHRTKISMAEVWAATIGGRGHWPFDVGELAVFTMDVVTVGHSTSESTDDARSHRFLLNNKSARLSPT